MLPNALPFLAPGYLARIVRLLEREKRVLLGLAGAPGAGKSTLAAALQRQFPAVSQVVPMDGFHLANVELRRLGRAHRKGAADTFDCHGYLDLLGRLRRQGPDEIVYAPEFRRDLEEPIAGAIPVLPSTRLVITEGNYLLLGEGAWAGVSALLDEAWYVDVDDALRTARLLGRHERFGRSQEEALAWVAQTDDPNARLIAGTRGRAQVVFHWDRDVGQGPARHSDREQQERK